MRKKKKQTQKNIIKFKRKSCLWNVVTLGRRRGLMGCYYNKENEDVCMNEKGGEVGDAFKAPRTACTYLMSSTIYAQCSYALL